MYAANAVATIGFTSDLCASYMYKTPYRQFVDGAGVVVMYVIAAVPLP